MKYYLAFVLVITLMTLAYIAGVSEGRSQINELPRVHTKVMI